MRLQVSCPVVPNRMGQVGQMGQVKVHRSDLKARRLPSRRINRDFSDFDRDEKPRGDLQVRNPPPARHAAHPTRNFFFRAGIQISKWIFVQKRSFRK